MAIDRRSVIGLIVGGVAGTLGTPILWKSTDDLSIWSQNWPWIPRIPGYGNMQYKTTVSKLDSAQASVQVLTVDGKPVQVYGNEADPVSQGGISPLAASETQLLYSPSRVKGPMKKDGDTHVAIGWDEAIDLLAGKLKDAGSDVAAISGDETGCAAEVFATLATSAGGKFYFMPSEGVEAARAANAMGIKGQLGYDLAKADLVIAVGADIFQSFGAYLDKAAAFAEARPVGGRNRLQAVYCGPAQNRTAAVCDEFIPLAPGQEAALLAALAMALKAKGVNAPAVPANVDVDAKAVEKLAAMIAAANKPLIIAGSPSGSGGGSAAVMLATALNQALGAPVTKVPFTPPVLKGAPSRQEMVKADLVADAVLGKAKAPKVLLVHDANPAYALPKAGDVAAALADVEFLVSFSSFMDETAAMADLILPDCRPMERYDDVYSPYGVAGPVYTVVEPVIEPVFDTKPAADVALAAAAKLGVKLAGSHKDVIMAKAAALGAPAKAGFNKAEGMPLGTVQLPAAEIAKGLQKSAAGLTLLALPETNLGSAKVAVPPASVVTIRPTELYEGRMFARLNGHTAHEAGVKEGQKVTLKTQSGEVAALVAIDETIMNGVVAVPLGFGHTAWDAFSAGKGGNVATLFTVTQEPGTGATVWCATPVEIA